MEENELEYRQNVTKPIAGLWHFRDVKIQRKEQNQSLFKFKILLR